MSKPNKAIVQAIEENRLFSWKWDAINGYTLLGDDPINACKPMKVYRTHKFSQARRVAEATFGHIDHVYATDGRLKQLLQLGTRIEQRRYPLEATECFLLHRMICDIQNQGKQTMKVEELFIIFRNRSLYSDFVWEAETSNEDETDKWSYKNNTDKWFTFLLVGLVNRGLVHVVADSPKIGITDKGRMALQTRSVVV
jgi:hypothetical protein